MSTEVFFCCSVGVCNAGIDLDLFRVDAGNILFAPNHPEFDGHIGDGELLLAGM